MVTINKKLFSEVTTDEKKTKREQFPDGWSGQVVVETIYVKEDGFYGPRFIAEFKATKTGQRGSMSLGLLGKAQSVSYKFMKSLYAACLGIDPKNTEKVQEEVSMDVHEAATQKDIFKGHLLDIVKVTYRPNPNNPEQPFVNFTFKPVVDAEGLPLTAE